MVGAVRRSLAALTIASAVAACSDEVGSTPERGEPRGSIPAPATTIATTTSLAPTTSTFASTTTTTVAETTTTTTTSTTSTTTLAPAEPTPTAVAPADAAALPPNVEVEIGRSVEARAITLFRRGTPDGVRILVVGVIHGNESDGIAVVDRLRDIVVPTGLELFVVPSMNPDGQAIGDRQNANGVDLNRNFPQNWAPLGQVGDWQYGGPSAASEPETQVLVALGSAIEPDLVFWYHQDLFRIAPGSGRRGEIRTRFAELTGLPIVDITGGTYTGTASQWAATVIPDDGVGITVELGPTISGDEADAHAAAILQVAVEFFG